MKQMKDPVEFLVMARPGVGLDKVRETLEGRVQGLEFVKTTPFSTIKYRAERGVFELLQKNYERLYGDVIVAMQNNQIKLTY